MCCNLPIMLANVEKQRFPLTTKRICKQSTSRFSKSCGSGLRQSVARHRKDLGGVPRSDDACKRRLGISVESRNGTTSEAPASSRICNEATNLQSDQAVAAERGQCSSAMRHYSFHVHFKERSPCFRARTLCNVTLKPK